MSVLRFGLAGGALAAMALTAGAAFAGSFDTEKVTTDRSLSSFESVYIAPVQADLNLDVIAYDPRGTGDRPVDKSDVEERASDFHDALEKAFSKSYAIASAPGDGVLTVEATLTDLASSRPTLADDKRQSGLSASSVYAGGGAMKAVLSENGVVLAEVNDSFTSTLNDGRARAWIWSDADRAFNQWSRNLVEFVGDH